MSINENQEFEAINQKTGVRNANAKAASHTTVEVYLTKKSMAKKRAIVLMVVTLVAFVAAVFGITGLEVIGWINDTFRIVLMCLAGSVAMFKVGYFWHEFKN